MPYDLKQIERETGIKYHTLRARLKSNPKATYEELTRRTKNQRKSRDYLLNAKGQKVSKEYLIKKLGITEEDMKVYIKNNSGRETAEGCMRYFTLNPVIKPDFSKFDPNEVKELGSYSKGSSEHWEILCELLGIERRFCRDLAEAFPSC